jgi:hypothetical protein
LSILVLCAALAPAAGATAAGPPEADPFYRYEGSAPLAEIAPGTVLKTRTLPYHVAGIPLPVKAVQLLYRSTGQTGQPTVNVTSVLLPPLRLGAPNVVAYQSFYDSLDPADEPSVAIAGGLSLGGAIPQVESLLFGPQLLAGNAVAIADTEGQSADFSAGPEYGIDTLDGLRAALASPATGLGSAETKIGLIGYSGGAIATEWAAELAPSYAPDVSSKLVGATLGGVLADPAHNLHYVDGSLQWAGGDPDGGDRRLARLPHRPHPLPQRIRQSGLRRTAERLDHRSARQIPRPHLGPAGEARIRDAGVDPALRRNRQPADHGDGRDADGAVADLPGRLRRARRDQR